MIIARRPLGWLAPCVVQAVFAWLLIFTCPLSAQEPRTSAPRAAIAIDAGKPIGTISPMLYGQFLEYMFQCTKGGLRSNCRQHWFRSLPWMPCIKRQPRRLARHSPPQTCRLDPVTRAGLAPTTWLSSERRGNLRWQTA